MKRLSIIIITWNEVSTLTRCLSSFYSKFDFERDEILVIDNGSTDGTAERMASQFSQVRYFRLPKNIGVGPARNRGLFMSEGRFCMTLDNDTVVNRCDFGDRVEAFFSLRPDCGVLGFTLLNADGSLQRSARRYPGWLQPLASRIKLLSRIPLFRKIQLRHHMTDVDFETAVYPLKVDYVLGANQVYRKVDAMYLGGYDGAIFFGPEDFDFCFRMEKMGRSNYLSNEIAIVHDYQRRTTKFSKTMMRHVAGYYYVMFKNRVSWL